MKELGEYLKEVRESNGVSIEEASDDLEIDSFLLENLEEGNVRTFRDVLGMKDKIKAYAKYLGLDPEEIADEFNDFLFEHTSKISLSDILAVEKEKNKGKEETVKKMSSPYTIVKQKKLNVKPILYVVLGFFLFIMLILLIQFGKLDNELKITIITMIATFILTTSKTIIDKLIAIIQYIISLLSEEQRGFSKNMGIKIDKIDFEKNDDTNSN